MMGVELSDQDIERRREPLEETLDFIHSVEAVCVRNVASLPALGGNMLLRIAGVGAWTLVVEGERPGFFPEATDDPVDFALTCEEWVLHELLDPRFQVDLEAYAEAGVFAAEGNFAIFQRLLQLAQGGGGNAVNVRFRRDYL